jgi:hypothetical protein
VPITRKCARSVVADELDDRLREKFQVLFRRQAAQMTDHEGVFRNAHLAAERRSIALREVFQADPGGHHGDRRGHAAFLQQVADAFAGGEDLIGEVGVAGGEFDHETFHRGRVTGHVVRILFVERVMGEHQRQIPVARDPHRGHAEQEGVLGVDDVRPEVIDRFAELRQYGQCHGEIAGVEILDRGDAQHVDFVFMHVGKLRCHDQHPVSAFTVFLGECRHRACHAADVRGEGVGEDEDVHASGFLADEDDRVRSGGDVYRFEAGQA